MNNMDIILKKIKDILKREIGLDSSTLGDATIEKILYQRMHYCQTDTFDDYYHYLIQNSDELTSLLETAVIPETWFFRDTRPFRVVAEHIKNQLKKNSDYHSKILCIPCSTGEEPYSIAMYLLHAGIHESSFSIQAVDISLQAIKLAKQAVYGENSFRNETASEFQAFYFEQSNGKEILKEKIKKQVSFSKMSILDGAQLNSLNKPFDFIFCRNLLIYFDQETKKNAFKNLHQIMKDEAMLFIGHSEFGAVPEKLFSVCGSEQAFGLMKSQHRPAKPVPKAKNNTANCTTHKSIYKKPLSQLINKKEDIFKSLIKNKKVSEKTETHINIDDDLLAKARQLTEQEKLGEAESMCYEHIDKHGDTADSFFTLGLINKLSGHYDIAESFFRKALYLEPKHHDSLYHLAALLEQTGDQKSAELLKKRLHRLDH